MSAAKKRKPKRGRPAGPPELVRSRLIVLRLTANEHERIAAAAHANGQLVAEWMRSVSLESATK